MDLLLHMCFIPEEKSITMSVDIPLSEDIHGLLQYANIFLHRLPKLWYAQFKNVTKAVSEGWM